jgi:asparaginyl-tRNA synthetase
LFTKVKTLTYQVKKAASNAAKPAKKQEKLIGEIEKPVNVPPLPAGLKVKAPVFDVSGRLNKLPRSWDLPIEL